MKKFAAAMVAVVTAGALASAGYKSTNNVLIGSTYALGGLGTARNSANNTESVGCYTYSYAGGASYGICYAMPASGGSSRSCSTTDPALLSEMRALSDGGYVYFTFDSSAVCTYIYRATMSQFAPKEP